MARKVTGWSELVCGQRANNAQDNPVRGVNMDNEKQQAEHLGSSDCSSAFNVLSRMLESGCDLHKQSGICWIHDWAGRCLAEAKTLTDMREQLERFDIEAHERRYKARCDWYAKNRNKLLGRQ
jgi:hypothetical protein